MEKATEQSQAMKEEEHREEEEEEQSAEGSECGGWGIYSTDNFFAVKTVALHLRI